MDRDDLIAYAAGLFRQGSASHAVRAAVDVRSAHTLEISELDEIVGEAREIAGSP